MGSLWGILGILLSGGKIAGLSLGQIEAIITILEAEGPAVNKLITDATPLAQQLFKAIAENAGKPPPTIPGYRSDGSVGPIHNPDAR